MRTDLDELRVDSKVSEKQSIATFELGEGDTCRLFWDCCSRGIRLSVENLLNPENAGFKERDGAQGRVVQGVVHFLARSRWACDLVFRFN